MEPSAGGLPFPLFLMLREKQVLLVGGGDVALRKARALWRSGCRLTVVSSRFSPAFAKWAEGKPVTCRERPYRDGEARSFFLIVSATDDPETNRRVYEDACSAERLVNVVDQPRLCNFFVPSVLERGNLQIAISSSGQCPAISRRIRMELDDFLPERYGLLLDKLAAARERLRKILPTPALRKQAMDELLASEGVKRFLSRDGEEGDLDREIDGLVEKAAGVRSQT